MLDLNDGIKSVTFARDVIEQFVKNKNTLSYSLGKSFNEKQGAFVTIHTFPDHNLRGCIGIPLPIMTLREAILEGAKSVTHDPRFPPLSEKELDNIIIEVTILTKPELIKVNNPKNYLSEVEIGRDGLIVEQGFYKGLLLPQVPVEQGWDKETFLSHTCMKAGLQSDSWLDKNIKILKFSGQIFTESSPREGIKEKKIDGYKC